MSVQADKAAEGIELDRPSRCGLLVPEGADKGSTMMTRNG